VDPDPGSGDFSLLDPGWKKSGSGMNILDHFPESLETVFRAKILKFFNANPDSGSGIRYFLTHGSEIRDGKIWIRDKHPGSATLLSISSF
jgi:hypothetical protein